MFLYVTPRDLSTILTNNFFKMSTAIRNRDRDLFPTSFPTEKGTFFVNRVSRWTHSSSYFHESAGLFGIPVSALDVWQRKSLTRSIQRCRINHCWFIPTKFMSFIARKKNNMKNKKNKYSVKIKAKVKLEKKPHSISSTLK